MRSLCLLACGCLVGLVVYTYDLKLKTRALEGTERELVTALQDENDFLALMRAEVGYLSRPERIEEMVRKMLKLEPVSPDQVVPWRAVVADSKKAQQPEQASRKDGIAALFEKATARPAH
jgi:hypothetical protein